MLEEKYYAHRGFHNKEIIENTMESFELALQKNYGIELDVHLSKDNKIIVFHDYDLNKMCNLDECVAEKDYTELSRLKLLNTTQKIPLLEDVLDLVKGKVTIVVEIKNLFRYEELTHELLKLRKNYNGRIAFKSFNHDYMDRLKIYAPELYCGKVFSSTNFDSTVSQQMSLIYDKKYFTYDKMDFLSVSWNELNKSYVKKFKKKNKKIICWTVKNKNLAKLALKLCDGVMFENFNP